MVCVLLSCFAAVVFGHSTHIVRKSINNAAQITEFQPDRSVDMTNHNGLSERQAAVIETTIDSDAPVTDTGIENTFSESAFRPVSKVAGRVMSMASPIGASLLQGCKIKSKDKKNDPTPTPSVAPKDMYYAQSVECASSTNNDGCKSHVKASLAEMKCTDIEEMGACEGAVLGNNVDLQTKCCANGTEYDDFLLRSVKTVTKAEIKMTAKSTLIVVDLQNDFMVGSFSQPCFAQGGTEFIDRTVQMIQLASSAGAMVIATMDFHPHNHCSFMGMGPCLNTKDYKTAGFGREKRYVNDFPSHTSYTFPEQANALNYAIPTKAPDTPYCKYLATRVFKTGLPPGHFCSNSKFVGAQLDTRIFEALSAVPVSQVEIVYNAVHENFDSFSAVSHLSGHHLNDGIIEASKTGGRALSLNRSVACHGKWHDAACWPTKGEIEDPTSAGVRSVVDILNAKQINDIYVTGLVFDYAVQETAAFAAEAMLHPQGWARQSGAGLLQNEGNPVTVIADLSRPSFDGKPGAPFNTAGCADGTADGSFCTEGGGTLPHHEAVNAYLAEKNVSMVRMVERHCTQN